MRSGDLFHEGSIGNSIMMIVSVCLCVCVCVCVCVCTYVHMYEHGLVCVCTVCILLVVVLAHNKHQYCWLYVPCTRANNRSDIVKPHLRNRKKKGMAFKKCSIFVLTVVAFRRWSY